MLTNFHLWLIFLSMFFTALAADIIYWRNPNKTKSLTADFITIAALITISLLFAGILYFSRGSTAFLEYITGYIIELSLSVDNLFVFIIIFRYFKVPNQYQHRVLLWGIIGAFIMRIIMIIFGVYLVSNFKFIFYGFGGILIYSSYVFLTTNHNADEVKAKSFINLISKYIRVTKTIENENFIIYKNKKYYATPLLLCLLLIEKTDLVFAIDSIPAILAITQDTLIVTSSNLFAVMGLRAMYFVLEKMIDHFSYLKYGLSIILCFIGIKMIIGVNYYHIPTLYSLMFILFTLIASIILSLLFYKKDSPPLN